MKEGRLENLKTHTFEIHFISLLYIKLKSFSYSHSITNKIPFFKNYIFTIVCHNLLLTMDSQCVLYLLWGFV